MSLPGFGFGGFARAAPYLKNIISAGSIQVTGLLAKPRVGPRDPRTENDGTRTDWSRTDETRTDRTRI